VQCKLVNDYLLIVLANRKSNYHVFQLHGPDGNENTDSNRCKKNLNKRQLCVISPDRNLLHRSNV
jgi:hypothetical protein